MLWFVLGALLALVVFYEVYNLVVKKSLEKKLQELSRNPVTLLVGSNYDPRLEVNEIDRPFVESNSNLETSRVGVYEVTYTVLLGEEFKRTIKVIDGEPPTIKLNGDKIMAIGTLENWADPGAVAYDTYDGDLTAQISRDISPLGNGEYLVKYSVSDKSGYTRSTERKLVPATGIVCLTFDDGPSKNTEKILDILKNHNAKATFFVLSFNASQIDIIKREIGEGHTVGLHGISHEYSEIYQDLDTLMANFKNLRNHIRNNVDSTYNGNIIRFPGGSSNTISNRYCPGIMDDAIYRAEEEGFVYFDWNVDSNDAGGAKTAEEISNNVISGIKAGRTNVVLMHDAASKDATVEALDTIIKYCVENGFVLEPITEATELVQHKKTSP